MRRPDINPDHLSYFLWASLFAVVVGVLGFVSTYTFILAYITLLLTLYDAINKLKDCEKYFKYEEEVEEKRFKENFTGNNG